MAKHLLAGTAEIATSFFKNNEISQVEIPDLIKEIFNSLATLEKVETPVASPATPAVSIKASITPDYLVSLESGQHYRTLIRHLKTLGLTPMQYRAKWGLPLDYPMVAPSYARQRSDLARAIGLGTRNTRWSRPSGKDAVPQVKAMPLHSATSGRQQGKRART